jgi:hypothetical protein
MKKTPYIAKIVEYHKTRNGNFFCREEGKQEISHHLDWEIFIPEHLGNDINGVPFWGIIVTDQNNRFFNGKTRLTCRVFSYNRCDLEAIFEEERSFQIQIEELIEKQRRKLEYND